MDRVECLRPTGRYVPASHSFFPWLSQRPASYIRPLVKTRRLRFSSQRESAVAHSLLARLPEHWLGCPYSAIAPM